MPAKLNLNAQKSSSRGNPLREFKCRLFKRVSKFPEDRLRCLWKLVWSEQAKPCSLSPAPTKRLKHVHSLWLTSKLSLYISNLLWHHVKEELTCHIYAFPNEREWSLLSWLLEGGRTEFVSNFFKQGELVHSVASLPCLTPETLAFHGNTHL